jgi:hypothetical protein
MKDPSQSSLCICRCTAQVPPELIAERLCVLHFTQSIERTCTQTHRQIALDGATDERKAKAAIYINESALLLARLASNVCLSDELKRRVLSTFLSLMNLRENLERAASHKPDLRLQQSSGAPARAPAVAST